MLGSHRAEEALSYEESAWSHIVQALKLYVVAAYHYHQNPRNETVRSQLRKTVDQVRTLIAINIKDRNEDLRWVKNLLHHFFTPLGEDPFQTPEGESPIFWSSAFLTRFGALLQAAAFGKETGPTFIDINGIHYELRHTPGKILGEIINGDNPQAVRRLFEGPHGILHEIATRKGKRHHRPFFDRYLQAFMENPLISPISAALPEDAFSPTGRGGVGGPGTSASEAKPPPAAGQGGRALYSPGARETLGAAAAAATPVKTAAAAGNAAEKTAQNNPAP